MRLLIDIILLYSQIQFIFLFSQQHKDFRIAEFCGICHVFGIPFDATLLNTYEHIFVLDFPDEVPVKQILSRSILVKSVYEYMFQAETYEQIHDNIKERLNVFEKYNKSDQSYSIRCRPVGRRKGLNILNTPKTFAEYLPLDDAPVNLDKAQNEFTILEEYEGEHAQCIRRVFFGRLIGDGQYRLKVDYNLKTRVYIGNTTMDPELSFIQTNVTAIKSGDLVLDPFVGTGGLLLPAAHFGATVVGTEINYQVAKGMGKSSRHDVKIRSTEESLAANFEQYGTSHRFLAVLIADASQHGLWRGSDIFDAIVSDPPYGVREKSRKIGKKVNKKENWLPSDVDPAVRFPEKEAYDLDATFSDLCDLAAEKLVVGARVSFWFPVILENYSEDCLPGHPALRLVANCEQTLTRKTARRLLVYEKIRSPKEGERATTARNLFENETFRDVLHPQYK